MRSLDSSGRVTASTETLTMVKLLGLLLLAGLCLADIERSHMPHKQHDPRTDKDHFNTEGGHNAKFDHEAILGTREMEDEFSELAPEEAKRRLRRLVMEHDTNQDGIISRPELAAWVSHSFKTLDEEEALDRMKEEDANDDGILTWDEYITKQYGYTAQDVKDLKSKTDQSSKEIVQMLLDDEERFRAADLNHDERLDMEEYKAFFHPSDYNHMHKVELDRLMREFDANKNGMLEKGELIKDTDDPENRAVDEENFSEHDKNKDGRLEGEELKHWALLDSDGQLHLEQVQDEAEHLISMADSNGDGQLSMDEILDKSDEFVGGQVTNYGQFLHKYDDEL